jgi:hypothetical protein
MLTALQNRATGAAYSSALGNAGIDASNKGAQNAYDTLAKSIPGTDPRVAATTESITPFTDFLKSSQFKDLYTAIASPNKLNNTGPLPASTTDSFGNPNK